MDSKRVGRLKSNFLLKKKIPHKKIKFWNKIDANPNFYFVTSILPTKHNYINVIDVLYRSAPKFYKQKLLKWPPFYMPFQDINYPVFVFYLRHGGLLRMYELLDLNKNSLHSKDQGVFRLLRGMGMRMIWDPRRD